MQKNTRCSQKLIEKFCAIHHVIEKFLNGDYLFLLYDLEGILLKYFVGSNVKNNDYEKIIKQGTCLNKKSCGKNFISIAINSGEKNYLSLNKYSIGYFKHWDCYTLPIESNENILAYICVISIDSKLTNELLALNTLLKISIENYHIKEEKKDSSLKYKEIIINKKTRSAMIKNKKVHLEIKELNILEELIKKQGEILSREELMEAVWKSNYIKGIDRVVDTCICKIKKKIPELKDKIKTIRGKGYLLEK